MEESLLLPDGKQASSKKVYKGEGTAFVDLNFKHSGMKKGKRENGGLGAGPQKTFSKKRPLEFRKSPFCNMR